MTEPASQQQALLHQDDKNTATQQIVCLQRKTKGTQMFMTEFNVPTVQTIAKQRKPRKASHG